MPSPMPSPMHSPMPSPLPSPSGYHPPPTAPLQTAPLRRDTSLSDDGGGSKRNPLIDLMETEKTYVEQLTLVIRVRQSETLEI